MLNNSTTFADKYTQSDIDAFNEYANKQLGKVDVEDITAEEYEYMRSMLMTMYSNPVKNQLAAQ
jgi:hypothetical protein